MTLKFLNFGLKAARSAPVIAPMAVIAVLFAISPAFAFSEKPQSNDSLAPHKALYDVRLNSSKSGSQIINISGKMYYEWKPSCEGWITNHRFTLNYEYADNAPLSISSDFSTFESFDGQSLNFSSRRKRDGEVYEELRGKTVMNKDDTERAEYSLPEGLSYDLAKGSLFPTGHTIALLDAAKNGKKFLSAQVFDGSDDDGPVDINAFIGKKINDNVAVLKNQNFKQASNSNIDASLVSVPAWNIRMAFFPINNPDASSDYELSMVFHENGIISDMMIDYADFSVHQKLVALEKLKPETCATDKQAE